MKKMGIIILTLLFVISGFQIIGAEQHIGKKIITEHNTFQQLATNQEHNYISLSYTGTNGFIEEPGHPQLPVYNTVIKIPGKARITHITCTPSQPTTEHLTNTIIPVPPVNYKSISHKNQHHQDISEDEIIYSQDTFYPSTPYEYSIRCGLDLDGSQTTFLCITTYPVQYNPVRNTIQTYATVDIKVTYEPERTEETTATETYDLVIIAPEAFTTDLQPFVSHKISMGLTTLLKTTEDILSEYSGRDEPEQIKYFIKDAKENWNTQYILLCGGLKSYIYAKDKDDHSHGAEAWHVPVRYTNIQESDEVGCISDLYYSDLYRYNEENEEWEFEDWDSSGDGIFAKYSMFNQGRDDLDLVPDIHIGRLACRNKYELQIIRDKIIGYESTSPSEKPWFRKMIGITGKNFDLWEGVPDGEYLVDRAFENMSRWIDEEVRVYASNVQTGQGPIPNEEDIVEEISKGAGFIDFEGHGNPIKWNTIHADGDYDEHEWVGGIDVSKFLEFSNGDMLPVVMVGGCHNGLFNLSILRVLLTRSDHHNYYWTWVPSPFCFNWAMVIKPNGGAIASVGATGYGPASGADPISLQGEIDNNFFYTLGQESTEKLGEAQTGMITKYITENRIRQRESFTATITTLFGDPSLQLGGYE